MLLKTKPSREQDCRYHLQMKKKPVRTCCSCGKKMLKDQLGRFVWFDDTVQVDPGHILQGRGAYCCKNEQCVERFFKQKNKWRRMFRL